MENKYGIVGVAHVGLPTNDLQKTVEFYGIGQCSHTNGNATFGWLLFRIISNSRLVVCIRI